MPKTNHETFWVIKLDTPDTYLGRNGSVHTTHYTLDAPRFYDSFNINEEIKQYTFDGSKYGKPSIEQVHVETTVTVSVVTLDELKEQEY